MTSSDRERRLFSRIIFRAKADLHQGAHTWQSAVRDLSLQGLSVDLPAGGQLQAEKPVRAVIHLARDTVIQMSLRLAHATDAKLGFRCENIDIDSIGHLRRLLELNSGDPRTCERELADLASG